MKVFESRKHAQDKHTAENDAATQVINGHCSCVTHGLVFMAQKRVGICRDEGFEITSLVNGVTMG